MSNETATTLTRDKIQQILSAVGQNKPKDDSEIAATDYDWNQPHFFNAEQLEKLNEFAKAAAEAIAVRFTRFFQTDFKTDINSTKQHYAGNFVSGTIKEGQKDYYLVLKDSENLSCGLIVIPAQVAEDWLSLLLGGSESRQETDTQLSKLEKSLLSDIAKSLAEAIISSNDKLSFKPDGNITNNNFSLEIGNCEELLEITFDIRKGDAEDKTRASLLLPCRTLLSIADKAESAESSPPKDPQSAILEHLNEIPVAVTVQLASTELTFEQIFTLQKQDILLLDKKIDEPLTLIVEGQKRFTGRLAKSQGKLASVIVEAVPMQNKKSL